MSTMSHAERRVARYMRRCLAGLHEGESAPTVRTAMKECRAGPHTVEAVVRRFAERGWLDVKERGGLFRGPAPLPPGELRILVHSEEPYERRGAGFRDELVRGTCMEIESRGWRHLRHVTTGLGGDLALEELVRSEDVDAAVLVGAESPGLGECLKTVQIPAVNLIPATAELPPNSIGTQSDEAVERQMKYLLDCGHRSIAYLHLIDPGHMHRDFLLRREAFYRLVAEHGLPHRRGWVQYGGNDSGQTAGIVRDMLAPLEAPDALIIYDQLAPGVYEGLAELGLRPGHDFSVLGTDNLAVAEQLDPPLTTLEVSRKNLARTAANSLDALLRNDPVEPQQWLQTTIIERASVQAG